MRRTRRARRGVRRSRGSGSARSCSRRSAVAAIAPLDGLNRLGAGAVAFALLTLTLGWFGLLYAGLFVPLLAAGAVLGVARAPAPAPVRLAAARGRRWQLALLALIGALRRDRPRRHVRADLVGGRAPSTTPPRPSSSSSAIGLVETAVGLELVPAVHGRDARARRLPPLGRGAGSLRAAAPRALRGDRGRPRRRGAARRTHGRPARGDDRALPAVHARGSARRRSSSRGSCSPSRWRSGTSCTSRATGWTPARRAHRALRRRGRRHEVPGRRRCAADRRRRLVLAARPADRLGASPLRAACARGGASVVRQERDPHRQPRLSVLLRRGERRGDVVARASFEEYGHGTSLLDLAPAAVSPARRRGGVRPRRVRLAAAAAVRARSRCSRPAVARVVRRSRSSLCRGVRARLVRRLAARALPARRCSRRSPCSPRSGWSSSRARGGSAGSATVAVTTGALAAGLGITLAYAGAVRPGRHGPRERASSSCSRTRRTTRRPSG